MRRRAVVVDVTDPDLEGPPSCLLYLLPVGQEREVVLALHGTTPDVRDLSTWIAGRAVVIFTTSREGVEGTCTVCVAFAHVLLARVSAYTATRHSTF